MNANEPVAWAVWEGRPHDLFFTKEEADELCRLKGGDAKAVPLYTHPAKKPAKQQYDDCMKDCDEPNPVERLRFYLSLALTGQDWLDVEPFIDSIPHPAKTLRHENHDLDRGTWAVGQTESQEFIESSDFNHDVRLYLNGDFETDEQRLNYLQHIADRLNTHPAKEHFEDKPQAEELHEILQSNTHPAKTLTDEEIDSIWTEMSEQCDEEFIDMKQFARAILKKAQEK